MYTIINLLTHDFRFARVFIRLLFSRSGVLVSGRLARTTRWYHHHVSVAQPAVLADRDGSVIRYRQRVGVQSRKANKLYYVVKSVQIMLIRTLSSTISRRTYPSIAFTSFFRFGEYCFSNFSILISLSSENHKLRII